MIESVRLIIIKTTTRLTKKNFEVSTILDLVEVEKKKRNTKRSRTIDKDESGQQLAMGSGTTKKTSSE